MKIIRLERSLFIISILLLFITLSCQSKVQKIEPETNLESFSDSLQCSCTYDKAVDMLFMIPEVAALNEDIRSYTQGKRGASILNSDPNNENLDYYEMKVGDNNELRFQTYYRFIIEKTSCDIFVIWGDEQHYTLAEWNKINGIGKYYKNSEDSIKYTEYLNTHYRDTSLGMNNLQELKKCIIPFDYAQYFNCCLGERLSSCDIDYPNYEFSDNKFSFYTEKYDDLPTYYFILFSNEHFSCILFEIREEREPLKYRLATMKANEIISDLYLVDSSKTFVVSEDYIRIYTKKIINEAEEEDYEENAKIGNGNLIERYQIREDGKITKLK